MPDEDDLSIEWRNLQGRDYAREGIPVILGIETVGRLPPRAGEPGVAAAFRELAGALADGSADPAAIVEILAARELRRLE